MTESFKFHGSDKADLRAQAMRDAWRLNLTQQYRHLMRTSPRENQQLLQLTDAEVDELEGFSNRELKEGLECRYVVVGLPHEDYENDPQWYHDRAKKASHKVYVGKCWYALEMGSEGTHPHYNFFFYKKPNWLANSRLITEFATTFQVDKNFVKVDSKGEHSIENIIAYIAKENGVVVHTNFSNIKGANILNLVGDSTKSEKSKNKKSFFPKLQ